MLYEFVPVTSPQPLGLLTKRVAIVTDLLELANKQHGQLGQARQSAESYRNSARCEAPELAKRLRIAYNFEQCDRYNRLQLANPTSDILYALKRLCTQQDPETMEIMSSLPSWLKEARESNVVHGTELLINALAAIGGCRANQDLFGTSQNEDAAAELQERFHPAAKKLVKALPELPFWFGRETHESATHLLALSLVTAIGANHIGMSISVQNFQEADVKLVSDYLAKAGWGGARKQPEPQMNYPSIKVYMPPLKIVG
jgi:hypothetical protein